MRSEHGFTLIEVLVALVILSSSLGVVLGVIRQGLGASENTIRRELVVLEMGSLFKRIGRDIDLVDGVQTGRFTSGANWRIHAEPYLRARIRDNAGQVELIKIAVTATWTTNNRVRTEHLSMLKVRWPASK